MENDELVLDETLEVQEEEAPKSEVVEPQEDVEALRKKAELANNYKIRAEKAEAERKALELRLNQAAKQGNKVTLDVEDYIDISASLEGLDQREKEYLSQQHKLSGKPLKELRQDEDFVLWQTAYQAKKEKELSIKPSGTQTESERPKTLTERLAKASLVEKEKILEEQGLWRNPRPRVDRVDLGRKY